MCACTRRGQSLLLSAPPSYTACSPARQAETRDLLRQAPAVHSRRWATPCRGSKLSRTPSQRAGGPRRCAAIAGQELAPWWVDPAAQPSAALLFVGVLLLAAYSTWDL